MPVRKPYEPGCDPSIADKPNPYASWHSVPMHLAQALFYPTFLSPSNTHRYDNNPYPIRTSPSVAELPPHSHKPPTKKRHSSNPSIHNGPHLGYVASLLHPYVRQNDGGNPMPLHPPACIRHEANESRLYNKVRANHKHRRSSMK